MRNIENMRTSPENIEKHRTTTEKQRQSPTKHQTRTLQAKPVE